MTAPLPPVSLQRLATLCPAAICAREGCRCPVPPGPRRGSPRRFCSPHCRWLAWTAVHSRRGFPPLAARLVRALALEVVALEPGMWRVDGGQAFHLVGPAGCDCPDRAIRGPTCKHELAVMLFRCDPALRAAVHAALIPQEPAP